MLPDPAGHVQFSKLSNFLRKNYSRFMVSADVWKVNRKGFIVDNEGRNRLVLASGKLVL